MSQIILLNIVMQGVYVQHLQHLGCYVERCSQELDKTRLSIVSALVHPLQEIINTSLKFNHEDLTQIELLKKNYFHYITNLCIEIIHKGFKNISNVVFHNE
jgi:hypothetical protein